MAGKATQSKQADDVIGGAGTKAGKASGDADGQAAAHELQTQLDAASAEAADLKGKPDQVNSRNERLNAELAEANAALKAAAGNAEANSLATVDRQVAEGLVSRKVITAAQSEDADLDPLAALFTELDSVTAERNSLKRSLAAQKGATTRKGAELEQLEASLEPRKLGPVEDPLTPADLHALLADEARVEIAFSDGKRELAGVPPAMVPGERFTFRRGRLMLAIDDFKLRGPADERGARVLAGYALLIDGEQVAWLPRLAGQLTLGAGQTYQLKDDVVLA